MTYAELAKERDDLRSENETLREIMDKMLERGKKLEEKNKQYLDSIEEFTAKKCALRCPMVDLARKETAKEICLRFKEEIKIVNDERGITYTGFGALLDVISEILSSYEVEE